MRLDENYFVAGLVACVWNRVSRVFKFLAGAFIFVEASAFKKIGGFSNELFAAEELELSQRLKRLARETGRKVVVLHRHPLMTSARKMRLYSVWDHFTLLWRVLFRRGTLARREACHLWYDGRR